MTATARRFPAHPVFEFFTACASVASILGSAYAARLILASLDGMYGGTWMMILLLLAAQLAVLAIFVGVPAIFLYCQAPLRIASPAIRLLLISALIAIAGEALALFLIPASGNC
jgi:hypothetical protein